MKDVVGGRLMDWFRKAGVLVKKIGEAAWNGAQDMYNGFGAGFAEGKSHERPIV